MHPFDPIEFYEVPQVFGPLAHRVGVYKVHNMNLYVLQSFVIWEIEVFAYFALRLVVEDVVEVGLEPVQ